ncbi:hypothetical protein N7510_010998 [Penicillium lagena]|uniref:uncharacterized protein n=1 Tax=Penicillium lagena TaxID=94218 RepID=UPI00254213FE|nr:uncharacterized protein N7510_010998 [Penicillium lagena]KAJ5601464.1 hypothetical protein N7510_010998 [Penicillium lagena]
MATVMGGVGYGMYFVANVCLPATSKASRILILLQRYIKPLIAPPTPPQLEQDKENIDEQFSRAFALIEQLSTDTTALKEAEDARTERLDSALKDVESVVAELKSSSRRRDDETRRISDEVKSLKDAIPKALEGAREGNENRLKELGSELKSLKVLLGNRLGGSGTSTPAAGRTVGSSQPETPITNGAPASVEDESPAPAPAPAAAPPASSTATPLRLLPPPTTPCRSSDALPLSRPGRWLPLTGLRAPRSRLRPRALTMRPAPASKPLLPAKRLDVYCFAFSL